MTSSFDLASWNRWKMSSRVTELIFRPAELLFELELLLLLLEAILCVLIQIWQYKICNKHCCLYQDTFSPLHTRQEEQLTPPLNPAKISTKIKNFVSLKKRQYKNTVAVVSSMAPLTLLSTVSKAVTTPCIKLRDNKCTIYALNKPLTKVRFRVSVYRVIGLSGHSESLKTRTAFLIRELFGGPVKSRRTEFNRHLCDK
jgi:hypothetical protein